MLHRIHFEKSFIAICPMDLPVADMTGGIMFSPSDEGDIPSLVEIFLKARSPISIYVTADDTEATYRQVCSEFKEVNAGGGLVRNSRGDFLLIRRNGLWDLPKGHQEKGEDIRETSLREVREETGVSGLKIGNLICVTDHCYIRDGIRHLKHTWWYDMLCDGDERTVPQSEEGITKAEWVGESDLKAVLEDTYPSINEVFGHLFQTEMKQNKKIRV